MNTLAVLTGGLAAAALALGTPVVHAWHTGFAGGCGFVTANDTTPGGQLGGENQWNGVAYVAVVATDSQGFPQPYDIRADCVVYLNGNRLDQILAAPQRTGATANSRPYSFTAERTDVVTVCTEVTVDHQNHMRCTDATTTQVVPQPVVDIVDLAVDTLNDAGFSQVDPTVCPVLAALSPGVPGLLDVDGEGDVAVLTEPFWDCPPYDATE